MSLEQFVRVYEIVEIKELIGHDYPTFGAYQIRIKKLEKITKLEVERKSHGFYAYRDLASARIEVLKDQKIKERPDFEYKWQAEWNRLVGGDEGFSITYLIEPKFIESEKVSEVEIFE